MLSDSEFREFSGKLFDVSEAVASAVEWLWDHSESGQSKPHHDRGQS